MQREYRSRDIRKWDVQVAYKKALQNDNQNMKLLKNINHLKITVAPSLRPCPQSAPTSLTKLIIEFLGRVITLFIKESSLASIFNF